MAIADGVVAAVSAANPPPVAPLQSTNTSVQSKSEQPQPVSKPAAPTRPRPPQVIRDSLDVLTGQRPEPAEAKAAEQQQQQDAAA